MVSKMMQCDICTQIQPEPCSRETGNPILCMDFQESMARKVYLAMRFQRLDATPDWVPGGNSHAQDEARRCASAIIKDMVKPIVDAKEV